MAGPKNRGSKSKDPARRGKKKISPLSAESVEYVDYKDVDLLRRFLSDRAKIRGRYASGNSAQQQKIVSVAIKNAREMGLLPYASRVTTQRRGRGRRDDDRSQERDGQRDRSPAEDAESEPVETETTENEATAVEEAQD